MSRIITILTLTAFLNLTMGCAKYVNMSVDEVKNKPDIKVSAVKLPIFIEGIELTSGNEVIFKNTTGRFDNKTKMIGGLTQDGIVIEKNLNELKSVLLKRMTIEGQLVVVLDVKTFEKYSKQQPWKTIDGICVQDGEAIRFDKKGYGRYYSDKNMISGTAFDRTHVKIQLDDMRMLKVKPKPGPGDMLMRVIVVAVISCGVFFILLSDAKIEYDVM